MADTPTSSEQEHRDFFISYTHADQQWAEWIAWQLQAEGYTLVLQAWDFRLGDHFIRQMGEAIKTTKRTLAVLSPDSLDPKAAYSSQKVLATLVQDPTGQKGKLLAVRVRECTPKGLLAGVIYVDLFDLDTAAAKKTLLAGVYQSRRQPLIEPLFPGTPPTVLPPAPGFPGSLPPIWNVPSPRNLFFTGRDALLEQLAANLRTGEPTALGQSQAISGLGGIGKTQIALEYAYRYRQDYQAVLWAQADTRENLTTAYLALARLLHLPEQNAPKADEVVAAVNVWLQIHTGYLLILDNADDLALARDFLPPRVSGHLVLTTRAQATGRLAPRLEVKTLPQDQGALLLLHRAKVLTPDASLEQASASDHALARAICDELTGLPLALDQAGAYIEETGCRLSEYEQRYRTRRAEALKERGSVVDDHPQSVATTLSLSFEKVEQKNCAAREVLWLCAFLAPDAIPEEIITEGCLALDTSLLSRIRSLFGKRGHTHRLLRHLATDVLAFDQALGALQAYSLIRRDATSKTLSMHRLIQAVLVESMTHQSRQQWAERAVLAVNGTFPGVEHASWPQRERLLPHALVAAQLIEQEQITRPEAARLLNHIGDYFNERARYQEAEPFSQRALAIRERYGGSQHPDTAQSLNNQAWLYDALGKYAEAERLYRRALFIDEKAYGSDHPHVATDLNTLAALYKTQGKYAQAEPLYQRVLAIREQQLGPEHPDTVRSLNTLAALYKSQDKYTQAEPLYQRVLAIREQQLGPEHPWMASSLNNLAALYHAQGKYPEAEPLYRRTLAIREQQRGPEHPDTAQSLDNLAELYRAQGQYAEAEPFSQRALAIREQQLGPEHPDTATNLNTLALLYRAQGQYGKVEPLLQRALAIREQQLGPEHPSTANSLNNLAVLYQAQGKYAEAEPFFQRALVIREQQLGPEHPDTARSLNNLAGLYHAQGRYAEAESLFRQALAIREQQLGSGHPETAQSWWWLASLARQQDKLSKAKSLYEQALRVYEYAVGTEHPDTRSLRAQYKGVLRALGPAGRD